MYIIVNAGYEGCVHSGQEAYTAYLDVSYSVTYELDSYEPTKAYFLLFFMRLVYR
jgi:hypothetical protein